MPISAFDVCKGNLEGKSSPFRGYQSTYLKRHRLFTLDYEYVGILRCVYVCVHSLGHLKG